MADKSWTYDETTLATVNAGDFVGSKTVILAAGPATMALLTAGVTLWNWTTGLVGEQVTTPEKLPVLAVLQNLNMQSPMPLIRIGEIGSNGRYFIRDRGAGSITLSRLVFDGPSLLAALYQGTGSAAGGTFNPESDWNSVMGDRPAGGTTSWDKFWLNLEAKIFGRPFGLYYVLTTIDNANTDDNTLGEYYFENCYISSHGMQLGQGTALVAEGVSLEWSRILPITASVS